MFRQATTTTRCADASRNVERWKFRRRIGHTIQEILLEATPHTQIDSYDSENRPPVTKSPSKITPSELHFSIGDKTTKIHKKRNVARKSIARKTKEPRNTLAPQWNIIPDGTTQKQIDTPLRKNTVIRKNELSLPKLGHYSKQSHD